MLVYLAFTHFLLRWQIYFIPSVNEDLIQPQINDTNYTISFMIFVTRREAREGQMKYQFSLTNFSKLRMTHWK